MVKKLRHNPEEHDWDYTTRKTVHTKLYTETHKRLRMKAAELNLSVQEILQCFAEKLGEGDGRLLLMLKEYKRKKRKKETESFFVGRVDVEELYEAISDQSPFKDPPLKLNEELLLAKNNKKKE